MRNYTLRMDEFGLSQNAYKELRSFCLQYGEKKQKIADYMSLKSPNLSGMPHGFGVSNPTGKAAELAEKYQNDVELIESTVKEVAAENAEYLLKNVTTDKFSITALKTKHGMKMGENQFRQMRKKFYFVLAKKKQMI